MSNNISLTFLQVLLKKDFLTLWRNKGFLLAFIVMPLLLMTTFVNLQDQTIDRKDKFGEGSMIEDYWSFTSTKMLPHEDHFIPYKYVDEDPSRQAFRSPASCLSKGNGLIKLNFTKIAIVSNDKYIAGNASRYFKDYVFKVNNFPEYWEVV